MSIPLAGSPSETTVVEPNKHERFAANGGSNPLDCSGKSLMSMDLCLRSEDFGGTLDAIMSSDDEDDNDGDVGGICSDLDSDDGGTRPIMSSDFVENVILTELKAPRIWEPSKGTEPSLSRPQDEAHELRAMENLTAQLERVSTGTLLSENWTNPISSSGWAKDFEIDADAMETVDPSLFDDIPSISYSPSRRSPSSHHHEGSIEVLPLLQPELLTSDINGTPNPPASSFRSSETPLIRGMSSTSSNFRRSIDVSRAIDPTDDDVLFGRGGHTNTHPGNIRFRERALALRPWYESCSKEEKYHVSNVLIESVKSAGHRFLEKGSDGLWHEVVGNGARKKASQALRERVRGTSIG